MKKNWRRALAALAAGAMLLSGLAGCTSKSEPAASSLSAAAAPTEFVPALDPEASAELNVAGFFGNFEALDQVINGFNEYYPNVTVSYEQNSGGGNLAEYLRNNQQVDIFMTDDTNLRYPDWTDYYILDNCVDLTAAGVDVSAMRSDLLPYCTFDGKLLRVPMGLNLCGIVVNKTLLRKEGLEVPTNYAEFLEACKVLKEKGYTPIQGPNSSVYGLLAYNLAMTELGNDPALLDALNKGDETAVTAMTDVFKRLETLKENGYIDNTVNAEYPDDNYDGAILKFFEGDVPFWVCSTEKVSGMKKRESKSESFSANPFEYQFVYAPMGDEGACAFVEPWVGFSVNRDAANPEYAVEFLRFLAQGEQLDTLASVKGVPSVTSTGTDDRYTAVQDLGKSAQSFVNDGTILNHVKDYFRVEAAHLGEGATAEEVARAYVQRCAETAASMAENQ